MPADRVEVYLYDFVVGLQRACCLLIAVVNIPEELAPQLCMHTAVVSI